MVGVSSGYGGTGESGLVSAGVYIGRWWWIVFGLFGLTSVSSTFRIEGSVTLVGGASLVGIGSDTPMSTGFSAGGSGGALHLASRSTIGGSESLFDGRGGSDRGGCVSFSLDSRSSTDSGSVTMSSADTGDT